MRDYLNNCAISGLPAGACGPAGESVAVHPLTLEYAAQTGGAAAAGLNISLAHNLALGGKHGGDANFQSVRLGARARYTVLRASANLSLPVFDDWPWPAGWRCSTPTRCWCRESSSAWAWPRRCVVIKSGKWPATVACCCRWS